MKRFDYRHNPVPFDPKYPHGWRGETQVAVRVLGTVVRLTWHYRLPTNDPDGVDTACAWNYSPRRARFLHVFGYYAGNYRYMYHFMVGKLGLSFIPVEGHFYGERLVF